MSLSCRYGRILASAPSVAVHVRGRIAVIEATHVGAYNLVLGSQQVRRQRALDRVGEERVVVDGLVLRLGHLEHERPVGTRLWARRHGLAAADELFVASSTLASG